MLTNYLTKTFVWLLFFTFFVFIFSLLMPLYIFVIMYWAIPAESINNIFVVGIIVLGAILFMQLLDICRFSALRILSKKISTILEQKIMLRLYSCQNNNFSNKYKGEINANLQKIKDFLQNPQSLVYFDMLVVPLQLAIIFFINRYIGLIVLMFCLVLFAVNFIARKRTESLVGDSNKDLYKVESFIKDCMLNKNTIKTMDCEADIDENVKSLQNNLHQHQHDLNKKNGLYHVISKSLTWTAQILILFSGMLLLINSEFEASFVILVAIIASKVVFTVNTASSNFYRLSEIKNAFLRLHDFVCGLSSDNNEKLELPAPSGEVEAKNIMHKMGEKLVINDVSFKLLPGQTMCIIGANGSGKTTLLKILCNVIKPLKGIVNLDNANIEHWNKEHLGKHVGYVPQNTTLLDDSSIFENIARFENVDRENVSSVAQQVGLKETINNLQNGLDTKIIEFGGSLPASVKQKILLARAIITKPKILILDEPDLYLDKTDIFKLVKIIEQLSSTNSTTTIVATHNIHLLNSANLVLTLDSGRTVAYGTKENVINKLRNKKEVKQHV